MIQNRLLVAFMLFCCTATSQTGEHPYLFRRNPNAAAEAMGGAFVAAPGSIHSVFYNPAGIGEMKGVEVGGSIANLFYQSGTAYFSGAVGMKWNPYLSSAFTYQGASYSLISIYMTSTDKLPLQKFTLTTALSFVKKGLYFGVNLSRFELNEYQKLSAFCIDAGAKQIVRISRNSNLYIAADIKNLTAVNVTYTEPFTPGNTVSIPTYATAGIAYQNTNLTWRRKSSMSMLNQLEYRYNCRTKYYNTIRFGTELVFWKKLALRGGYYHVETYPGTYPRQVSSFTYGAGLILKLRDFDFFKDSRNEWQFDFCNLAVNPGGRYTTFSVLFRHRLKNDCLTCPELRGHYGNPEL